jgi:hypothetical protein
MRIAVLILFYTLSLGIVVLAFLIHTVFTFFISKGNGNVNIVEFSSKW